MSIKNRLERKKYLGVWRWEPATMVRIMRWFPKKVIRYKNRNSPKRRGCSSVSSENPNRKKFCNLCMVSWFHIAYEISSDTDGKESACDEGYLGSIPG